MQFGSPSMGAPRHAAPQPRGAPVGSSTTRKTSWRRTPRRQQKTCTQASQAWPGPSQPQERGFDRFKESPQLQAMRKAAQRLAHSDPPRQPHSGKQSAEPASIAENACEMLCELSLPARVVEQRVLPAFSGCVAVHCAFGSPVCLACLVGVALQPRAVL